MGLRDDVERATDEAQRNPNAGIIGAAMGTAVAAQAALPDVNGSDITADLTATVGVAWARCMADVLWVGKGKSPGLNYEFRGIDAVLDAVGPVLRKHGVSVVPVKVTPTYEKVTTGNNKLMTYCRITVDYMVLGPTGDVLSIAPGQPLVMQSAGEAFDSGDKSTPKAQSVALRTLYLNAFAIPTHRPADDPEYANHELAAPKPPTAEEYYAEIMKPTVSVQRLREIKAELSNHPDIGATEIEEADGRLRLISIVTRQGLAAREREQ